MPLYLAILSHVNALCRYQVRSEQDERRPFVRLDQLNIWAGETPHQRLLDTVLAGTVPSETPGTSFIFPDLSRISRPILLLQECSMKIDTAHLFHTSTTIPLILLFLPFLFWYTHILVQGLSPGQKCTPSSRRYQR